MAKLSQQIRKNETQKLTRTERVVSQQQELRTRREEAEFQKAKELLESATYENYGERYYSINPKFRSRFISPEELQQTDAYKRYQKQQTEYAEAQYIMKLATKKERGKAFVGFGESEETMRLVGEYLRGVGEGTTQEKRERFLRERYPNLEGSQIGAIVSKGIAISSQGYAQPKSLGLDVGETRTILTKDAQGRIKSAEVIEKRIVDGKETVTTKKEDRSQALKDVEKQIELWKEEKLKEKSLITEGETSETPLASKFTPKGLWQRANLGYKSITGGVKEILPEADETKSKLSISGILGRAKKGYEYVLKETPELEVGVLGGGRIKIKDITEPVKETITQAQQEIILEEITGSGLKQRVDEKYQGIYQQKFEEKYYEDIVRGNIDFETASQRFSESEEAKQIGQEYNEEIIEGRRGKWTTAGLKIYGLSLARLGVNLVPETSGELALEGLAVYGGTKVLGKIPTAVVNVSQAGFGSYGVYKAVSPKSLPEEKVGGLVIATVSFGSLGIQGIKYLRRPTVKFQKVDVPKTTLKTHAVGREGKKLSVTAGGKTSTIQEITYGKQKLSQTAVAGRRTIVNTKWRDFLGLKPIYQGIPTAQKGTTYVIEGLRGTTVIQQGNAYQKAINLLVKRGGYTTAQAKATLRFYYPKFIEIELEKGNLAVISQGLKNYAKGKFTYLIKQPKILANKELGIYTRGARTIRDVYDVERTLVQLKGAKIPVVVENITKTTTFVTKSGGSYNVLKQAGKTTTTYKQISAVDVSDVKLGILKRTIKTPSGEIVQLSEYEYQNLLSAYLRKKIYPATRTVEVGLNKTQIIKSLGREPYVEIDLDKASGVTYKSGFSIPKGLGLKKTPFSKTFGEPNIKELAKIEKTIRKNFVRKASGKTFVSEVKSEVGSISQSEYYGRGAGIYYEEPLRVPPSSPFAQTIQQQEVLKSAVYPTVDIKTQIRNIIQIKQGTGIISKLSVGASVLALNSAVGVKANLKINQQLKEILREELEQSPVTRSDLKVSSQLKLETPPVYQFEVPNVPEPSIPRIEPPIKPIVIPPPFLFGEGVGKGKKKKSRKSLRDYYIPDFTSRILGLKEERLTEKDAIKRVKQILTGLEIRRSVRLIK